MLQKKLMELALRVRSLSQNGMHYASDEYDKERYEELLQISHELSGLLSGVGKEDISRAIPLENDYVTPKVDIRAVVFNKTGEILLVKERADGLWSLPGGWADVGYTPSEVAVKEVREETGLDVVPKRLLAIHDKKCHNHPPAMHYAYKLFILCELTGGTLRTAFDILDNGFFAQDNIPPLSLERVTGEQIEMLFTYRDHPGLEAAID